MTVYPPWQHLGHLGNIEDTVDRGNIQETVAITIYLCDLVVQMVTKGLILNKFSSLFIFIIIIVCIIDHQTASDTSPSFNIYVY